MKRLILLAVFLCAWINCAAESDCARIHFIDVGQADAILIQSADKNMLIDTAGILGVKKLAGYLEKNQIKTINHLIITHPHLDHMAGLFFILPKLKIEYTYDNGCALEARYGIFSAYEKNLRRKKNYRPLKAGDIIKMGEVILEVLWPEKNSLEKNFNYNSLVIMLSYKKFKCLLTADINTAAETELLKRGKKLKADIFKVAHHGGDDSSSAEFIKIVKPKIAVISAGGGKKSRYPGHKTLSLLTKENIKIYRTGQDGSLVVTVDEEGSYTLTQDKAFYPYLPF